MKNAKWCVSRMIRSVLACLLWRLGDLIFFLCTLYSVRDFFLSSFKVHMINYTFINFLVHFIGRKLQFFVRSHFDYKWFKNYVTLRVKIFVGICVMCKYDIGKLTCVMLYLSIIYIRRNRSFNIFSTFIKNSQLLLLTDVSVICDWFSIDKVQQNVYTVDRL